MLEPVVRDPDGIRLHALGALMTQVDHSYVSRQDRDSPLSDSHGG